MGLGELGAWRAGSGALGAGRTRGWEAGRWNGWVVGWMGGGRAGRCENMGVGRPGFGDQGLRAWG